MPRAVFLDAPVSSRPETAKVDRKTQNRKKVSLLFQALTRELMPACGVSGCALVTEYLDPAVGGLNDRWAKQLRGMRR